MTTVKEVKIFVVVSNKKMLICDLVMILSLSLCSSVCVLVVLRLRRVLVTHATTTTVLVCTTHTAVLIAAAHRRRRQPPRQKLRVQIFFHMLHIFFEQLLFCIVFFLDFIFG